MILSPRTVPLRLPVTFGTFNIGLTDSGVFLIAYYQNIIEFDSFAVNLHSGYRHQLSCPELRDTVFHLSQL